MLNRWAYYNEHEPELVYWLRALIKAKAIVDGEIDSRSIADVRSADVAGFRQCHWFAGIGGWAYALRIAGWDTDRIVWTGSCPCQPYSTAGKGTGQSDPRNLWPTWFNLISECKPATIFGEQVATIAGLDWIDTVYAHLENAGYAVGTADLCAAGVGSPHVRQRLFFVGTTDVRNDGRGVPDARSTGFGIIGRRGRDCQENTRPHVDDDCAFDVWKNSTLLRFDDGIFRPIERRICPLAYGVPARMVRLRGYGNAIVPQVAAAFVRAYIEVANG